jgi:hypothetical protein
MIFTTSLLATTSLLSPTKKRTLFSRLPLSEPTISDWDVKIAGQRHVGVVRTIHVIGPSSVKDISTITIFQ